MEQYVISTSDGHRLEGSGGDVELVNQFLSHLRSRAFSPASVRAYAYDLLNFLRFLAERLARLHDVVATDLFDYLDWQQRSRAGAGGGKVVRLAERRGAAPATMNRRIAAVRGLFEFAVTIGVRAVNPVPAARRSSGLRAKQRGLLGHIGAAKPRTGGLVRQPRRLPEALEPDDVAVFLADLRTFRDRAITLLMLLGGLRAAEVRSLRLADVDMGLRRVRVTGKGGKERIVPVDGAFFAELAAYLRDKRPARCASVECFVVLRGPTAGRPLTEAGLRRVFRTHRQTSGAIRVRPHRLRHTYGTELAAAGIDLLVLRDLMGHANPETTAAYVSLAAPTVRAAYEEAMSKARTRLTLTIAPAGKPIVPDRVEWLRGEMLKTRVAHGYCSRQLAADACPYANVCEQCDNFVTATEFIPTLQAQLADVTALHDDAAERGWQTEVARHARVIASIQSHLERLSRHANPSTNR